LRVFFPFFHLQLFDRFFPQFKALARHLDELHVGYWEGKVDDRWTENIIFHKLEWAKTPVSRSFMRFRALQTSTETIKSFDPDILYCLSSLWYQEICRHASKTLGVPYVVRLRLDFKKQRKLMSGWIGRVLTPFWNKMETRSLQDADMVIPISSSMVKLGEEIKLRNMVEVIPIGVDTDSFKPINVERSKEFTVGYVGRLAPEKGIGILLRIMKAMPDTKFLVAGRNQIKDLKFPKNTTYLGRLNFKEMPQFYNSIDTLILPSFTEAQGLVILEALSCGVPVVTSNVIPNEIPIVGRIVEERSVEAFQDAILKIKTSSLDNEIKTIRKIVQRNFSHEAFAQKTADLLRGIKEVL